MNAPMLVGRKARMMPLEAFKYAFANSLSDEEAARYYARYAVPESRKVPQDSVTKLGKVDFAKPHPPILFVCGSKVGRVDCDVHGADTHAQDQIVPVILNRKNYDKFVAHDKETG
jgi:hypothetical protein